MTGNFANIFVNYLQNSAYKKLLKSATPHYLHNRLRPFFRDHPGEPVPEENFWTLWCKGRLTEADTQTIRLGATPSGLSSAPSTIPHFITGRMPFLPYNQQRQSTEGNYRIRIREKTLEFSSTVLPARSSYLYKIGCTTLRNACNFFCLSGQLTSSFTKFIDIQ